MKIYTKAILGMVVAASMHGYAQTQDNYLCDHRVEGEAATFGMTHYGCDVKPFGDEEFVTKKFSELVFDDQQSSESGYVEEMLPVLRDAADYYLQQRQPEATEQAREDWRRAVMALAQQQSFWTHYRQGSDGRLKMSRGDNGHGHGLMQLDDREHFNEIVAGKGWNLFENISFALDAYYAPWTDYAGGNCSTEASAKVTAQYAYAVYSGGASEGCRFEQTDNPWQAQDDQFAQYWEQQAWLNLSSEPNAAASVDVACFMEGEEGCVPLGPLPPPKADIGSLGQIDGNTFDGDPNTIAACRAEPNGDAGNVEWIRTTTNPWATASQLTLLARQGDWVQVSFEYSGLTNTCWTLEYPIGWEGFEPPPPPNDTLFAYKQLVLDSGETCLHSNGEFHCVTQSKDALCLLEKLDQVVEPQAFQLNAAQSASQPAIIYDRHTCLTSIESLAMVGDSIRVEQVLPVFDSVGGSKVGETIAGTVYQVLDVSADTKYQINRYYKILVDVPATETTEATQVAGYIYAGNIEDYQSYAIASSAPAAETVILKSGTNFVVEAEEGLSMSAEVGGDTTLTIPKGVVMEIKDTLIMGDNNRIYYEVYRKGIRGVVYAGMTSPQVNMNPELAATTAPATPDESTPIVTPDTEQQITRGGSTGWGALILLFGVLGLRRNKEMR